MSCYNNSYTMKKGLNEIITVKINNLTLSMSLVEKQNDIGLMSNQRIFLLNQGHFFGYASDPKQILNSQNFNLSKAKITVPIANFTRSSVVKQILTINFVVLQKNERVPKKWILKMYSEKLARQWNQKLQQQKLLKSKILLQKNKQQKLQLSTSTLQKNQLINPLKPSLYKQKQIMNIKQQQQQKEKQIKIKSYQRQPIEKLQQQQQIKMGKIILPEEKSKILQYENQKFKQQQQSNLSKDINQQQQKCFINPLYVGYDDSRLSSDISILQNQKKSNLKSGLKQEKKSNIKSDMKQIEVSQPKKSQLMNQGQSKYKQRQSVEMISNIVSKSKAKQRQTLNNKSNIKSETKLKQEKSEKNLQIIHERAMDEQRSIMKQHLITDNVDQKQLWTYKYLTKPHTLVFQQFTNYCSNLLKEIVEGLILSSNKRKYKPKLQRPQVHIYYIEEVQCKIAIMDLIQVQLENSKFKGQRICSMKNVKTLEAEFKNYRIIYNNTQNQGLVRVPLMTLCEYNGFIALFKAMSVFKDQTSTISSEVRADLQTIYDRSRITSKFHEQSSESMLLGLNQNFYQNINYSMNKNDEFHHYILQQIKQFLPLDIYQKQMQLRPQLIQQYITQQHQHLISQHKNNTIYNEIKQQLSQAIFINLNSILPDLESLKYYFFTPQQFTQFLHNKGINIKFIGLIYQNLKLPIQRRAIMTQIAARTCKNLLRKTLQDIYMEDDQINNVQNQSIILKIIDFLNCLLGNSYETAAFWKVMAAHCEYYFKIDLKTQQIENGSFIISLVHFCGLEVLWDAINPSLAFKTNNFFNSENVLNIKVITNIFQPKFDSSYYRVLQIIKNQQQQGFDQLCSLLQLNEQRLPEYLSIFGFELSVKKYLANFTQPETILLQNTYSHLHIFQTPGYPCRLGIDIELLQIKWFLSLQKKDRYIHKLDSFIGKVNKFYGDFHPLLSQLYQLFSNYHLKNGEYQDAITFAKSSLVNILKICGTNHEKTSDCYYILAKCYMQAGKKQQAITHLKKAKSIYQSISKTSTISYALLGIHLGTLYLNQDRVDQCISITISSLQLMQKLNRQSKHEQEQIRGYELLARCYELLKMNDEMIKLSVKCIEKLIQIKQPLNLQKMMKICLYPKLISISAIDASRYLDIIALIPQEISTKTYSQSFSMLKIRIKQTTFIKNLENYLRNLEHIQKFIHDQQILRDWCTLKQQVYQRETVNDFLSLTEELIYFVGKGFLTGSLRQAL